MEKCPICGIEIEGQQWHGDNWLEEEYQECPAGHYSYHYSYGYTIIHIGNECFHYNYRTPYLEIREIMLLVSHAIEGEKLAY